jgi:hypothetical protein
VHVTSQLNVSQRLACRVLDQHRSTQRRAVETAEDEAAPRAAITDLAKRFGRYGYRRITALLRAQGWSCNHKRVERIWRAEGLKVPGRPSAAGSGWRTARACGCARSGPTPSGPTCFVEDRTRDGRKFRMLNVVDEFTRECLAIRVGRQLKAADVIDVLADLFIVRGVPGYIRSDNGPEFVAKAVRAWISGVGASPAFIGRAPKAIDGSPWKTAMWKASCMDGPGGARRILTFGGGRVRSCIRPVCAAYMTAGPDGVRGSAPNQRGGLCAPKALLALPISGPAGSPSRRHRPRTSWARPGFSSSHAAASRADR